MEMSLIFFQEIVSVISLKTAGGSVNRQLGDGDFDCFMWRYTSPGRYAIAKSFGLDAATRSGKVGSQPTRKGVACTNAWVNPGAPGLQFCFVPGEKFPKCCATPSGRRRAVSRCRKTLAHHGPCPPDKSLTVAGPT